MVEIGRMRMFMEWWAVDILNRWKPRSLGRYSVVGMRGGLARWKGISGRRVTRHPISRGEIRVFMVFSRWMVLCWGRTGVDGLPSRANGFNAFDYLLASADSRTHDPHHGENHQGFMVFGFILTHGGWFGRFCRKGGNVSDPPFYGRNIFFFYCVRKSCVENFKNRDFCRNSAVF